MNNVNISIGLLTGLSLVLLLIPLNAEARKNIEDVSISLDRTCIALIKSHAKTNCPTYEEILLQFPDTSNKRISGDFIFKDGMLQRANPKLQNHFNSYTYESPVLWIDPPGDVIDKTKHITIASKLPIYFISESYKKTDNTIKFGTDRYVNSKCTEAIISAENWEFLLGDTIQYLQNGCTSTNFDSIKKIYQKPMDHDIKSTAWYKYTQWLKNAKQISKDKFLINPEKKIYSPEAR